MEHRPGLAVLEVERASFFQLQNLISFLTKIPELMWEDLSSHKDSKVNYVRSSFYNKEEKGN